ncbi:MAG TPA: phosphate ABC transporter substrate-binding/OmpA family protein [Thermoanaerobaculia bacterium]|jgi:outer membrane protein OmpA-like peptidoglycan-associated protein|nr:phosphate ABC transporter substrate-binding/OmpA family protein [Thermoanaerobaculia bacterium]
MRLTPFAKFFITVVVLAVVGYAVYHYKGADVRKWAVGGEKQARQGSSEVSSSDFSALKNAPADPSRDAGANGVQPVNLGGSGSLDRPLVVAINTWAGHSPGIVYNNGLEPNAGSNYRRQLGMDVKFVLIEDPAAKLAAFRNGDVDVMWNTVDNWAREASVLAEQNQRAKSVVMQDWSRGGDGIVSLASMKAIEDLKGHKIACTQFTPSHFLLLYLLAQSGLSPEDRAGVEKNIIFTQDAPAAAAMFKARQVDAAVTWEPDLSGAVTARGDEAHVLISTTAATNIIADTLCARQDVIDRAPGTIRNFIHGWFQGIEMMKKDPASSYAIVGKALKLDSDTVSGMLSGLKLTPYADNAQFYGLTGGKAHYETLFDTAFVIWRKKGLVTRSVDAKDWADTRFLSSLAAQYPGQKVEEPKLAAKTPSKSDRAIINKQIEIHFTPGSDSIMPGSFFVLDALGDTMTSFGNTYLRVEGNTDAIGTPQRNMVLSERRALAVKNYIVQTFPNIDANRFQTIGRGSTNPVADNATEAGRQLNRRTEIKVVLTTH